MNFTFEIADETAREIMQVCNTSLLEQVKTEIIKDLWLRATTIGALITCFVVLMFGLGWLLAGFQYRRRRS